MKKFMSMLLILSMCIAPFSGMHVTKRVKAMDEILGNSNGFLLSDGNSSAKVYVDTAHEEISGDGSNSYCGLEIIANTFAEDVGLVTGKSSTVVTDTQEMSGNVIIAGTIGHNQVIDSLINRGIINADGLYKDGSLKWDCYQMQFVDGAKLAEAGYAGISKALVITGSNKRGAMYGLFNISEHIGVSAWVYMADAVPVKYQSVYLDAELLEFNKTDMYLAKEPSVKYRGFFINDEAPSFTGWAGQAFGGVNENCYQHIFELIIRMKANYLWPAMWGNSFSDEGKSFKLANAVMADAYGVCMGTSHHEACCRAGVEWQRVYRDYGTSNAWNYDTNSEAIYKFWQGGIERNGNYESTITMGMRGEADSALSGTVQQNIDRLKTIITDQNEIIDNYIAKNPDSKAKDALKIYIPYSENEEFFYGPDDGSIDGLNVWDGMDDVTIMLTDDNYGNVRSLPEEKVRDRKAGWGMYYHLDGHVGTGAYEWVSSTQLEHIWDQLTMTYDYNVRNIWVINVGDVKPLEMELNYAMDLAYDMEKWGQYNTAKTYRKEWLQKQLGGKANCPDEVAEGVAECVADFLKISTYRKAEFVKSDMYSFTNYNEAQQVLELCEKTIQKANYYYDYYFRDSEWDDAYYQIVYYQAVATANVTKMQIFKGLNDFYAKQKSSLANTYAWLVDDCIEYDKELTDYYNNTMSDGKWKNMMSSPHVGFVTWDSKGWAYPEAQSISLPDEAKMLVSPESEKDAYEEGNIELPVFTNTMKQSYCVTMSNGGTTPYEFSVGTRAEWIKITNKNGTEIVNGGKVETANYFYISIDWTKVRSDKTGTVVIKGNNKTVKLTVKTDYTEYKSKGIGTHFESDGVIVIDGNEYINNVASKDGTKWEEIKGYGRYNSAMKMFPTTKSFTIPTGNTYTVKGGNTTRIVTEFEDNYDAPYLEYQFYADEDAEYTFTLYTTTTNNIFKPSGWGYVPVELFYAITVGDGAMQHINSLPDGKYISYAADGDNRWKDGIMNNIHVSSSKDNVSAGLNTVRIYGMHAGLGVERLVISREDIKESYLGPNKTFMLDYDIIPEQKDGVRYEANASELYLGEPKNLDEITDKDDINDAADPVEIETPIPRPYVPPVTTPAPVTDNPGANVAVPNVPAAKKTNAKTVKKGKIYTVKKLKYKVTKITKKGGNVTFTKVASKKLKSVIIPAKVKIKGMVFKVTAIGKKAFRGCKRLKKITIKSKSIKKIPKSALKGVNKKVKIKLAR